MGTLGQPRVPSMAGQRQRPEEAKREAAAHFAGHAPTNTGISDFRAPEGGDAWL